MQVGFSEEKRGQRDVGTGVDARWRVAPCGCPPRPPFRHHNSMKENSCENRTSDSSGKHLQSGNASCTTIQSTTGLAAPMAAHQGHYAQRPGALPARAHRTSVSPLADCERL